MRILVVGATGMLGTDLCRLLRNHHEISGWARRIPASQIPVGLTAFPLESVDITDIHAVGERLMRWKPHIVIHTAAMSDVDACELDPGAARAANTEGTGNVAASCRAVDATLIAISTDYVFDGSSDRPYEESDSTNPVNAYGLSKLEGERLALQGSPRCIIVRVSGLFGSGRSNFVSSSFQKFKSGQPVPVVKEQIYSPSYTVDLSRGIELLINQIEKEPESTLANGRLHGPLHLANTGGASRLEVAQLIAAFLGAPESLIRLTNWKDMNRPARRPVNSRLSTKRFSELTGSPLRNWKEAVRAYLETEGLSKQRVLT